MTIEDVSPRITALRRNNAIIGLENIELISCKPLSRWLNEIQEVKQAFPRHRLN
jgi:hypothetical protein